MEYIINCVMEEKLLAVKTKKKIYYIEPIKIIEIFLEYTNIEYKEIPNSISIEFCELFWKISMKTKLKLYYDEKLIIENPKLTKIQLSLLIYAIQILIEIFLDLLNNNSIEIIFKLSSHYEKLIDSIKIFNECVYFDNSFNMKPLQNYLSNYYVIPTCRY